MTATPTKREARTMKGVVVSDKMDKTVVVVVERYVKHPKYGKYQTLRKRFKAHDEGNMYKTGDKVVIAESKPISKDKSFVVVSKAA
ncbi:MAG: 30S ribosomal protein S17 [Patescibacteria group bacterium]